MKSNTFLAKYVKPMLNDLVNHNVEPWVHQEYELARVASEMRNHIKRHYRGDVTADSFFYRLLRLAAYYAYTEESERNDGLDFETFLTSFHDDVADTMGLKGDEYAPDTTGDRLFNFKDVASLHPKGNPLDGWAYYMLKHVSSLLLFVTNRVAKSEPIYTRCVDVAAYSILGLALHDEWGTLHSGFMNGQEISETV